MCDVCGCGRGEVRIEGRPGAADHRGPDHGGAVDHAHGHPPAEGHHHEHGHADGELHGHAHPRGPASIDFGAGPGRAPGLSQSRMIEIERDILAYNDGFAAENRAALAARGALALNLVSSPGAGKTTLLTATLTALAGETGLAVVEGDQETAQDAERIRATGVPAVQINTGKGCHLDAHMVGHALERVGIPDRGVVFVENVGNLVCPAAFDLGERHKVLILSVTEGEDKPIKYPDMFSAAGMMVVSKVDLLPHVDFDLARCLEFARRVNPGLEHVEVSARSGEGLERWLGWVRRELSAARAGA